MTYKNVTDIAMFSIVALLTLIPLGFSNVFAEESEGYKMVGDVTPVLTFEFRDGTETHEFPVFEMNENFVSDSGVSFSVEGTVSHSPLLHEAMDEAYKYRYSNSAFDYQLKYFDVNAEFVKNGESIVNLNYNNCRIDNYQVETLDSNHYGSYFKDVGFAIVDKIDFVCSGVSQNESGWTTPDSYSFTDYGESGFKFANDMNTSVTFSFANGAEKISFPVFNLVSAYEETSDNVVAEFSVEGVLDYYPHLFDAIDTARTVSGNSYTSNQDFDALVEFSNTESTLRGFDFTDCRVSDSKIVTLRDKEEGFTGKSGFVVAHQNTFTCSGIKPVNMYYDELYGDAPIWKTTLLSNQYVEPIQNTDKGLSAIATFTFDNGIETIEFSMFKQSEVLTSTEAVFVTIPGKSTVDTAFNKKAAYPTLELRGIVGDYPMLYDHVDENLVLQGVQGTQYRQLVDIDIDLVSGDEVIRGFNYSNCRSVDYKVETDAHTEESYVKNKFALENIFDFECQGYHPNNPTYDAMFEVTQADIQSTNDLRNTDQWARGFFVE